MAFVNTLFVYGTLCRKDVRRKIMGRVVATEKAILTGWVRKNGQWPYLVKKRGGIAKGLILKNLTARDFKKLDTYEAVEQRLYLRARIRLKGKNHFVYLPVLKNWPSKWL